MRLLSTTLFLAFAPVLTVADPMRDTVTPDNTLTAAPTEWLGDTPHLVIMGRVGGFTFDMQYLDLAEADLHALEVKREYLIDGDARPYQEMDFGVQAVIDGVAKNIEGKLNHADFLTLALPAEMELGPEENPSDDHVFTEFEFEWEGNGVSVNEEIGDWTGVAILEKDDAFGADEPIGDGVVGGYINAVNGDDTLVISFTFDVMEADVE